MSIKSICFAFADSPNEWNTSQWRSKTPSDGLNKSGKYTGRCIPITDFANYGHPSVQEIVGSSDAVVVQRNLLTEDVWLACDYWRGLGKMVCADLDDDYPHLTPQNPAYNFWIRDKSGLKERTGYTPIEALTEGFRHVDALMSPNELIIKDWSHIVRGFWLPNYAQWSWYKGIKQKPTPQDDEPIVIGWGGSISHWDGWWFSGLAATDASKTSSVSTRPTAGLTRRACRRTSGRCRSPASTSAWRRCAGRKRRRARATTSIGAG
jgi:hypothetical protein